MGYWEIVTFGQASTQRAVALVDLAFDVLGYDGAQLVDVAVVNIMEVDASTGFRQFGIRRRPFGGRLEIRLKGLFAVFVLEIEIQHDVVLRHLDPMEFRGINILERGMHVRPTGHGVAQVVVAGILRRPVLGQNIELRFRGFKGQWLDLLDIRGSFLTIPLRDELVPLEPTEPRVPRGHPAIDECRLPFLEI